MENLDFLLQKSPERIVTRVSTRTKEYIRILSEMRGMNESQYIKLALENQINADIQAEQSKQQTTNNNSTHEPAN